MTREQPPQRTNGLRIVVMSDTHELHREVNAPEGDILLFCGDFTMWSKSMAAILDFNAWLGELPYRRIVLSPGNHEFFLERDPTARSLLTNATVLINESVTVAGLNIWGSPVTPLSSGAFSLSSAIDRKRLYAAIPADTDVLITHTPPYGVLDLSPGSTQPAGCKELSDAVQRIRPKLHVFGHIHGAHGVAHTDDTTFVNAALLGADGDLEHQPVVLQMRRNG